MKPDMKNFNGMKRIFMMIMLSLILAVSASAQGGRDIYNRYSGKKGVSAVYISPAMFKLIKSLPDVEIDDRDVDFSSIIRTFDGMYILDVEDTVLAARLKGEVEDFVAKGKYELLMEAVDEDERMRIYVALEKGIVTDFMMLVAERQETSVISITGKMPFESLEQLLKVDEQIR